MIVPFSYWLGFTLFILVLLVIDLLRFGRNDRSVGIKEALISSVFWIFLAALFGIWVYYQFGYEPSLNFLTGYLLEESLSTDNLFVFLLIFTHFKVPENAKHKVLFYGILSAIVFRGVLIWGGIALLHSFEWLFLFFGMFLIIAGFRLFLQKKDSKRFDKSFLYRGITKIFPLTDAYVGHSFFIHTQKGIKATPLFVVLLFIEITDLIFALDSVPAILGITRDPFIVYTSNIFAILGLRSLFFALEGVMKTFYYIHYALAFILIFIGSKMLLAKMFPISTTTTLLVLIISISLSIIFSLYKQNTKLEF